jgi:hypothetical protein
VVFKLEGIAEGELKWCVGEVMEVAETKESLTVCEYGSTSRKRPLTKNIKWAARFRGNEMGCEKVAGRGKKKTKTMQQLDEFQLDASCKATTKALSPVLLTIEVEMVAEYGPRDKMFKKLQAPVKATCGRGPRLAQGHCLQKWVLDVLDSNPNVDWVAER